MGEEIIIIGKKVVPWKNNVLITGTCLLNGEQYYFNIHSLDTRPGEFVVKIEKGNNFVRLRGIDGDAPLSELSEILKYGIKKGKQAGLF